MKVFQNMAVKASSFNNEIILTVVRITYRNRPAKSCLVTSSTACSAKLFTSSVNFNGRSFIKSLLIWERAESRPQPAPQKPEADNHDPLYGFYTPGGYACCSETATIGAPSANCYPPWRKTDAPLKICSSKQKCQ